MGVYACLFYIEVCAFVVQFVHLPAPPDPPWMRPRIIIYEKRVEPPAIEDWEEVEV